ncbi:MAG: DNA polymerase I [Lachnospiraceae bacterium]|nr:DNA polymerase I [Lachnospiraceae bacterium]
MEKIVLIDGHSIMHRAFYGVPDLTNSEGLHTNAIYGFINILLKLLDEEKPSHLAVAFDVHAPTFRHKMFEGYKGTRKPMPEELREQIPVIKDVLRAMHILVMEQEGYEADDILGTMAKRAQARGMNVSLISGDRDLLQIADEKILIRIPKTKGGKTEVEDYDPKRLMEEYHVTPGQFIELKALMGDSSDNIPGVPKVGEKTAISLMEEYGSIDGIYENLENISKNAIRESLRENRELCDLSLKLATICIDAPISYSMEDATMGDLFGEEAYEWFKKLGFRNHLSRFEKDTITKDEKIRPARIIRDTEQAKEVFLRLQGSKQCVYLQMPEGSIAAADEEESVLFLAGEEMPLLAALGGDGTVTESFLKEQMKALRESVAAAGNRLYTFDVKKTYRLFEESDAPVGLKLHESFCDCKLMAYLVNPLRNEYTLEDVASEYAGMMLEDYKAQFGKISFSEAAASDPERIGTYVGALLFSLKKSIDPLQKALEQSGQKELFDTIEMPLTYVLFAMEREGVIVDSKALSDYSAMLGSQIDVIQKKIYEQVGEEFNINSPKQLGQILFENMELPGGKKTKTGYSTAADVLEKLAADYPVVADILTYRALTKLKSTYADGLSAYIEEDGRIHTNFQQMVTATGRLSSTEPNLQNIPMRTEQGRQIRKVFLPREGCVFVDADYSQIELRLLAHMSEDEELIEAYRHSSDIHRLTASKVFHTPFEEVTDLQRRNAKAVNFGIVYGISSFGLSQDLSISRKEAQAYIEGYFETYPGIKRFLDRAVSDAKETGESRTLYGRRRPIPELKSSNFMQRQFGERVAMNAPIQGTAADIMKIAMIGVFAAMEKAGLRSRLLLQVHDELLIETYLEEEEAVRKILDENMKKAADLAVELEIDVHSGNTWYDAK